MYSAIKVNGKKLYEYARNGENVDIPEREIEIYSIKMIKLYHDSLKFEVSCSKGTYIRTLCEDIAKKLDTIGTMEDLERIKVDKFVIENSKKINEITKNDVIPIEQIFKNTPKIQLSDDELNRFLNGIGMKSDIKIALIYNNNRFIGIAKNKNGKLIRDIIL